MKDDIVPESNYVIVSDFGECVWFPFYGRTSSHCSVDTTWFPFDEQHCQLVYASWKHTSDQVNLTTSFDDSSEAGILLWVDFERSDEWELIGNVFHTFTLWNTNSRIKFHSARWCNGYFINKWSK